jgi:hypothetical protein
MEFDRIKVTSTISNVSDTTYLNDEDANTTVAVVSVVRFDEAGLGSLYEQKAFRWKSKFSFNKNSGKRA